MWQFENHVEYSNNLDKFYVDSLLDNLSVNSLNRWNGKLSFNKTKAEENAIENYKLDVICKDTSITNQQFIDKVNTNLQVCLYEYNTRNSSEKSTVCEHIKEGHKNPACDEWVTRLKDHADGKPSEPDNSGKGTSQGSSKLSVNPDVVKLFESKLDSDY